MQHVTFQLAGIGVLAIFCQWLGWRLKFPAIVFLLIAGIAAGPVTGLIQPDALFGPLLFPLVSLSVAVILFEGSLTLRLADIRGVERVVLRLITVGTLVSWTVTTLAARWLVGVSWELATLFGAVMVVTGPTVIVPMLRTVRPTAAISNVLRWEGILIDPIGAVLAILTYQVISTLGAEPVWVQVAWTLAKMMLAGVAIGALCGQLIGHALRRHWLPEFLHNFTVLGMVFAVYVVANAVEHETGLLAVTVMGIWLANMRGVHIQEILDFKESLSIFLISGLFILLAARLDFALLQRLGWGALAVFAAVQFVGRPLKVALSTVGSRLSWRERTVLAWIGPRGIVAAAVSAVFGLRLEQSGYPQADLLAPLAFMVIIGTVVLQGATARPLARLLGVAEPEAKGFVIVGANRVARSIARALNKVGYRTLLTDTSWEHITSARREGLDTYYGNPVSEHADRHLELVGQGGLLALSPSAEQNNLAILRYRREFGAAHVFGLAAAAEGAVPENLRAAALLPGDALFGVGASFGRLNQALGRGAHIEVLTLAGKEGLADLKARLGEGLLALFAVDPRGRMHVYTEGNRPQLGPGWRLLVLLPEAAPDEADVTGAPTST